MIVKLEYTISCEFFCCLDKSSGRNSVILFVMRSRCVFLVLLLLLKWLLFNIFLVGRLEDTRKKFCFHNHWKWLRWKKSWLACLWKNYISLFWRSSQYHISILNNLVKSISFMTSWKSTLWMQKIVFLWLPV